MPGVMQCAGGGLGVKRLANGAVAKCCYRQARRCDTLALAPVTMTVADAATFPGAFVVNGLVDGECVGLYFDPADAAIAEPVGTLYTASQAIAFANCAAATANALACALRFACGSYFVNFHIKIEVWNPIPIPDGDFFTDGPNPDSCIGTGTAPADIVSEDDVSIRVQPSSACIYDTTDPADEATVGGFPVSASVIGGCTNERVIVDMGDPSGGDFFPQTTHERDRQVTVDGVYPGTQSSCVQMNADGTVIRMTTSSVETECEEAPPP